MYSGPALQWRIAGTFFAFEWEDPQTGRKQQYRWTVLPQVFTYSPNLFSQILEQVLKEFCLPSQTTLLQYVDDLLLFRLTEKEVTHTTVSLKFPRHATKD
jgi:hypothetical protein